MYPLRSEIAFAATRVVGDGLQSARLAAELDVIFAKIAADAVGG